MLLNSYAGSLQMNPQESPISFIRINPSQGEGMAEGGRFYWPRYGMDIKLA